jgi:glycosyltransferase involved in cell wall biosynthesis
MVNWKQGCAVVIPCLNEQQTIVPLVSAVRQHLPAIIVVDDGSSDETGKLAEHAGAQLLRHDIARGKGAALQTGWRRARELGFRWSLAMDGDGQHAPEDIPKFLRCGEETRADLVVGNRMHDTRQMPWLRRLTNRWMSEQLSALTGRELPDTQCGFRLMNLDTWAKFPTATAHFEIESEVLLAFSAVGARIEFVPIQVIYRSEQSKINPLRDTMRWFRWRKNARRFLRDFKQQGAPSPTASPANQGNST